MISRKDFLSLVLPPLEVGESYCTVGIRGSEDEKEVLQRFVPDIDTVCVHADEFVAGTYNAFFAMAKYGDEGRRTIKNAIALKSFYIDLDCGPGKPFVDLTEGLAALRNFCKATQLPKPTIVKSGVGAHIYWVCDTAMPRTEWLMHAERLKELCVQHDFKVDPAVTGEAARILRLPETFHVKDPTNPILVEVMYAAPTLDRETIQRLLEPSVDILNSANRANFRRQLDPLTLSLMGNSQSRFKTILKKSIEGTGCAQLARAYLEQATLEEPLWRGALSIAQQCVDRDKAIHILSSKHPEYSPEVTERKADETKGPYTCETFKKLYAAGCEGCPRKITSPIQLGKEVIEATEESTVLEQEEATKEVREYVIPKYPFPFMRGKNGGVYYRTKNREDEDIEELLYPYDFYVVKRLVDPDHGDSLWVRFHTPMDGVRELILPMNSVTSKDRCVSILAQKGIAVLGKKQEVLMQYMTAWMHELMRTKKAEQAYKQYGWTEDKSAIIVGDREIRATEITYSPPSSATLPTVPYFQAKGDFHTWKEIINHYATPGLEGRAFGFFMGFGAPLMQFTALDGFVLNMVHRVSGTGKTTILHAINSIYGRPKELVLVPKDTYNVRMNRLGVMQNLAVTMDEITNMPGDQMSQQVYDATSGRAKHRLKQHENVERSNNTKFQTGIITSSNRYITDMLLAVKGFPDGEMKRILEVPIEPDPSRDATWSRAHFERLMQHYGHAITPYAQALLGQYSAVEQTLNGIRDRVDTAAGIRQSERYWGLIMSLGITGGMIAKKLGLHDIPIQPVFDYAVGVIKEARARNREIVFDSDEFLGLLLQRKFSEILVINGTRDKRTNMESGPIKEPRGALSIRYEPDTKMLFVATSVFRAEVGKAAMNFEEVIAPYKKNKSLIVHAGKEVSRSKRMFAGTTASSNAGSMCLWFDTSKLEFFNEDILLKVNNEDLQPADPDQVE